MAVTRNINGDLVEEVPFQTIGGQGVPMPIRGGQGLISNSDAVGQEFKNGINDLAIILTQGQQQTEKGLETVAKLLTDLKDVQVAIAREGRDVAPPTNGRNAPSLGRQVPAPNTPPPRSVPQIVSGGFQQSRKDFSVGNVRQALGARLSDRLSEWEFGDSSIVRTPNGDFIDTMTGEFVNPGSDEVQALMRNEQITSAVRGGAEALAQGKSVGQAASKAIGAIPGGATFLKGLGVAGAGFAAVQMGTNWMEDQRKKNAEWQSALGGSNLEQVGERWNQRMFGWSQMGMMGAAEAERLYKEVAFTGLQGDQRTDAQQFALQNYRSMGMSIDDSMKYVREAAKHGTDSLMGLSGALKRVSDDAKEAGVNAEFARKQMFAAWEGASASAGGGVESTLAAEAAISMYGDSQTLSGQVGVEGIFGDEMTYMLSSQLGMTPSEFRARAGQDASFRADAYDAHAARGIELVAPGLTAHLKSRGFTSVNNENRHDVMKAVLEWGAMRGIDLPALVGPIASIFKQTVPADVESVAEFLSRYALGQSSMSGSLATTSEQNAYQYITDENRQAFLDEYYHLGPWGEEYVTGVGSGPGAAFGGVAGELVKRGPESGIKRLTTPDGKEYGVMTLLDDAEGLAMINSGELTIGGDKESDLYGKKLTEVLGVSPTAVPTREEFAAQQPTQKVDVQIGLSSAAERLLDLERYDFSWETGEPHK